MLKFTLCVALFLSIFLSDLHSQTKVDSYSITNDPVTVPNQISYSAVSGYEVAAGGVSFPAANLYNIYSGRNASGGQGVNRTVTGFTCTLGNFKYYFPVAPSPFTRVVINRREPAAPLGNKYTACYEYSSITNSSGTTITGIPFPTGSNIYLAAPLLPNMEDFLNSYSLNRGTDNVFVNDITQNTYNNIERIDLIASAGMIATREVDRAKMGILLNERGGNDKIKVAAITELELDGGGQPIIKSLGSLIDIMDNQWGQFGPTVPSAVFQYPAAQSVPRPSQVLAGQTISGVFVSLLNLQIPVNQRIYGIAVFPYDFTGNPVTLVGVNLSSLVDAGVDLMSGNFFAVEENIVLPLTLESFTATPSFCAANLQWKTSAETNTKDFEIQVNTGDQFQTIATIPAAGSSVNEKSYHYQFPMQKGTSYFVRLKMKDIDGQFTYSPTRLLNECNESKQSLSISPNPITSNASIKGLPTGKKTIAIYNNQGILLQTINTSDDIPVLNLQSLGSGMYLVRINSEDGKSWHQKMLKN